MATPDTSPNSHPPVRARALNILSRKPLTVTRASWIIGYVTVSATVVGGVLIYFTDHRQFPNIGDGLWWGIQTVTTVGYGDHVPTSVAGRSVAALVMIIGIGFLTVVTAAITSAFVESARRRMGGTSTDALAAKLDQISARLDAIEGRLGNAGGDPDAAQ